MPRSVWCSFWWSPRQVAELARAGMAVGLAGLFIEAHPDPEHAKCDGPSALPVAKLEPFLKQMKRLMIWLKVSKSWIPASNLSALKTKPYRSTVGFFMIQRQKRPQAVTPATGFGRILPSRQLAPFSPYFRLRHQPTIAAVIIPARIGAARSCQKILANCASVI